MAGRARVGGDAVSVLQVGTDHRLLPLEELERLHSHVGGEPGVLRPECGGVVALVTCHRVELYVEGLQRMDALQAFACWVGGGEADDAALAPRLRLRRDREAGRHLLRVAAGLESAVLGEDQILGQVRSAYRAACAAGAAGPLLHRLFHAAFRTGKRVRSETGLGEGGRSLAGTAVAALQGDLGGLAGRAVLVLGAGEMAALAARRLRERGVGRLLIANRTRDRAEALAAEVGAEVLPWEWRLRALAEVDGVVCATAAPSAVIPAAPLGAAAQHRTLAVVDLAVPRNVEVPAGETRGLRLTDLERLAKRLRSDATRRRGAVARAEGVVEEELDRWWGWVESRSAADVHWRSCRRGSAAS